MQTKNIYHNYLNFKQIAVSLGRLGHTHTHTHTLAEIKAWPSERIISQEQTLVKRFGYKGYNLVLAHALSSEIGGFTVPDFEIVEIGELWAPFYQANKEVIDKIISINIVKRKFRIFMEEIYKKYRTRDERRRMIEEALAGPLKLVLEINEVESLEELENKITKYIKSNERVDLADIRSSSIVDNVWDLKEPRLIESLFNMLDYKMIDSVIQRYYEFGRDSLIIIRTSATDEDTKTSANAGRYSSTSGMWISLLNQKLQFQAVLDDSLDSIIDPNVGISFVIQKDIYSDTLEGGIAFSTLYAETILELGYGDDEISASGKCKVNPLVLATQGFRSIIIRFKDGAIQTVSYNMYDKQKWEGLDNTIEDVNGNTYNVTMSQEQLLRIVEISRKIEQKLGYPVDIEFGVREDIIYIVQIRPITIEKTTITDLPRFNEEDILAYSLMVLNEGVQKSAKIVVVRGRTDYAISYLQRKYGPDQKYIFLHPSSIEPEFIYPYKYGEKIFWVVRHFSKVGHVSINEQEKGRQVIMAAGQDIDGILERIGPVSELEYIDDYDGKRVSSIQVSQQSFDLFSNGHRAVLVKAGAVPVNQ